jgi:hypothetical protein
MLRHMKRAEDPLRGKVAVVGKGEFLEEWTKAVEEAGGGTAVRTPGNIQATAQAAIEAEIPQSKSALDQHQDSDTPTE